MPLNGRCKICLDEQLSLYVFYQIWVPRTSIFSIKTIGARQWEVKIWWLEQAEMRSFCSDAHLHIYEWKLTNENDLQIGWGTEMLTLDLEAGILYTVVSWFLHLPEDLDWVVSSIHKGVRRLFHGHFSGSQEVLPWRTRRDLKARETRNGSFCQQLEPRKQKSKLQFQPWWKGGFWPE